ncbi:unnamed protein product [Adineta ricciae]|uniref:Thioredoxin domain-containing protein n=1 Tax=Adineta ricciae TaxID=249248 RepID=A0A816DE05_ADIRI|nr:unnamed protein product [Adineta ricciae]
MAGIHKLLNGHVYNKANKKVDLNDEEYEGMVFGLYFSAHWCGPCGEFTPKLVKFYNAYAEKKKFEIIFVSSDEDEESFKEYYEEMPWLTFDFKQKNKREKLEEKLEVDGIPTLVLIDGDSGEVICTDATQKISEEDPKGKDFPWNSDE